MVEAGNSWRLSNKKGWQRPPKSAFWGVNPQQKMPFNFGRSRYTQKLCQWSDHSESKEAKHSVSVSLDESQVVGPLKKPSFGSTNASTKPRKWNACMAKGTGSFWVEPHRAVLSHWRLGSPFPVGRNEPSGNLNELNPSVCIRNDDDSGHVWTFPIGLSDENIYLIIFDLSSWWLKHWFSHLKCTKLHNMQHYAALMYPYISYHIIYIHNCLVSWQNKAPNSCDPQDTYLLQAWWDLWEW